jgi:membrane protein
MTAAAHRRLPLRVLDRLDVLQQRHRLLAFPYAVYQKFQDDQAGSAASLLAYYAFASVFPLLLVFVTILAFVFQGDPQLAARVLASTRGLIPILGQDTTVHPLVGSTPALVFGSVLALWNGLGVAQQAQIAFNTVYDVPRADWPGFVPTTWRSLVAVVVGGAGFITTTLISGAITGGGSYGLTITAGLRIVGAIVTIVLDAVLFTVLFRFLTVRHLSWRDALPGASVAALGWYVLQLVGTALVAHELKGATSAYGAFATVIGLLAFFHFQALLTLYAAEINVVRMSRLWPRGLGSLTNVPTTEADRRAYRAYVERDRYARGQHIEVTFNDED